MNVKPCTFCLLVKSIPVLLILHVSTNICWKNPSLYIWYHVLLYKIKSPAMVLPSYSNVLQVSQRKSPTFVSSSDVWCTSTHSPSSSESSLQDSQSITHYTNMCIMILSLLQNLQTDHLHMIQSDYIDNQIWYFYSEPIINSVFKSGFVTCANIKDHHFEVCLLNHGPLIHNFRVPT